MAFVDLMTITCNALDQHHSSPAGAPVPFVDAVAVHAQQQHRVVARRPAAGAPPLWRRGQRRRRQLKVPHRVRQRLDLQGLATPHVGITICRQLRAANVRLQLALLLRSMHMLLRVHVFQQVQQLAAVNP
jgi:hypothetical protein